MKILYGIPGEGMGHATRSKVVIEYLLQQGHEVHAVSSSRAYQFLNRCFPGKVTEIKGFHFAFKDAQVSKSRTFLLNLKTAPRNLLYNFAKELEIEKSFQPDLVISDFESFSYVFARMHNLPVINIDNMTVMHRCALDIAIPSEEKMNYQIAKNIVKSKVPGCDHYFVTSFFDAPVTKINTTLVPPIIRPEIAAAKVSKGKHVLVYQSSSGIKTLQQELSRLPDVQFLVYGQKTEKVQDNVTYKPFSEQGFIEDFASARAVIANGGFSFISEAVYLHKPIYSFPIANQFEQYLNAAYIERLGFGRHFSSLDADSMKAFFYDLPQFEHNLEAYQQKGNEVLFQALQQKLNEIAV